MNPISVCAIFSLLSAQPFYHSSGERQPLLFLNFQTLQSNCEVYEVSHKRYIRIGLTALESSPTGLYCIFLHYHPVFGLTTLEQVVARLHSIIALIQNTIQIMFFSFINCIDINIYLIGGKMMIILIIILRKKGSERKRTEAYFANLHVPDARPVALY